MLFINFCIVLSILGEAAVSLGRREDLIKRAVEWCGIEDHPGVQGEANRLIAWLISNSRFVSINFDCDAIPKLDRYFSGTGRLFYRSSSTVQYSIW